MSVVTAIARGTDRAGSHVDLLVVSDALTHADAFEALQEAEFELARTVKPTVVTRAEWRRGRRDPKSFLAAIDAGAKLFIGSPKCCAPISRSRAVRCTGLGALQH